MDPDNPVVKLCVQGMQAEAEGRAEAARTLFRQAWDARSDDYEACIAAHFLARHPDTPEDELRWNREALERADAVGDDRVRGFYPSLYLNLAHSHELAGDLAEARRLYALAGDRLGDLPADSYGAHVRGGVARGRERTG